VHLLGLINEQVCIPTKFISHIGVKKIGICVVALETKANKLIKLIQAPI